MLKRYLSLLLCVFSTYFASGQLTYLTTFPPLTGGNGQNGITFNVKAINAITIQEISSVFLATGTDNNVTIWYHPTDSINGVPTVSAANGWIALGPFSVTATSTTALTQIAGNLNISFAANTVHGFHITSPTLGVVYTTGTSALPSVIADANMYISMGNNVGYGGNPPSSSFHVRLFCGQIGYTAGPPCPAPTGLNVTGVTSKTATIDWNAVASSDGYEYVINTSATPPGAPGTPTSLTNHLISNLTPATTYYVHVRNKCTGGGISQWVTQSFQTLPPCKPPVGFKVTNLQPTSATINWSPWLSALDYDYIVDNSRNDPTSSTGTINTIATSANVGPLTENTWYYVHIRSNCVDNEQSGWSLDSFLTPIVCRPPVIKISDINTDEAVAYWDAVPSALHYEYALTTSSTPPVQGTKYEFTTLHTPALYDGKEYYIHVRSHCSSVDISSTSDWGTASFKTFPVHINSISGSRNVAVYPNPVTSELHIAGIKWLQYKIMDVTGRTLAEGTGSENVLTLDMAAHPSGLYILQVNGDIPATIKFLKQ